MQTVIHESDGKVSIALSGRFDFNANRAFKSAYEAPLKSANVKELEIELSEVEGMDSSALGMLLMLREKAAAVNKSVSLANSRGTLDRSLICTWARLAGVNRSKSSNLLGPFQ